MNLKKTVLLVFELVLLLTAAFVWFIRPAVAQIGYYAIYIRSDGSIEGTDKIQRDGNIYTFTGDISGNILVERDSIVIDGAGYTLTWPHRASCRGMDLTERSNVTIRNMTLHSQAGGMYTLGIYLSNSSNNTIHGNAISHWMTGICIMNSDNNRIFHNHFIYNWGRHVYSDNSTNTWDDGYPSGGNCWTGYDYHGVDVKSGPDQDEPGSDGIGDTAYIIDANNIDHYPLMNPWGAPPPPSYTLTIYSSPTGVPFTVSDISRTTPWSGTYSEGA